MNINVTMNAPAGFGGEITGMPSGITYNVGPSGVVSVAQVDVAQFTALGFTAAPNTVSGVGTPGAGVTAVEYGNPYSHTSRLTLNTVLGAIAGGASLGLGILIYTLPAGAQIIESSWMNVALTQSEDNIGADTPEIGLGTVVASGAISVLSGTATFENILTQQAAANCTGTPTAAAALATTSPFALVSEAGGVKSVYLNVAAAWTAGGDPACAVTGEVIINWKQMN